MPNMDANKTREVLKSYGYDATDLEVQALAGLDIGNGGPQALAQYALTKSQQLERQAKDPLNSVLAAEKTFSSAQEAFAKGDIDSAKELYGQLEGVLKEAPHLFGNLTPDQIDEYMAPVKQQFKEADAVAQGSAARRGLGGSSTELALQGEEANKFKGQVLSTGVSVGMTQQQLQAKAIQDEVNRRTQLAGMHTSAAATGYGLQNQAAGQLSGQAQGDQSLLSSLPAYLRAQVLQELALKKQQEEFDSGSFARKFGNITGMINTGLNTASNVVNFVGSKGASTSPVPGFSSSPQPGLFSTSMGEGQGIKQIGPELPA